MKAVLIENKLILDMLKNELNKFDEVEVIGAYSSISEFAISEEVEMLIIDPSHYKINELMELKSHLKLKDNRIKIAITPMFYDEAIYDQLLGADIDLVLWKGASILEYQHGFQHVIQGKKYFTKEKSPSN